MKVRLSGNTIRYRLKEPEVGMFHETGTITEVIQFGIAESDHLKFTLSVDESADTFICYDHNECTIFISATLAKEWTTTDLVGFNAEVDTGKGKMISILVEKDFKCMDGREEDNIGSYPNPLAG